VKFRRSYKKVTPHGGIIPILKKIKEFGIPQVIRKCLGKRVKQAQYGYDDGLIAWVCTSLSGGKRIDHVTKMKKKLSIIPNLKLPSDATLGRLLKKLKTETITSRSISEDAKAKIRYTDHNDNIPMNKMLIEATKRSGALIEGIPYTLDIDATFLPTGKRGALRKYDNEGKLDRAKIGFNPMICLIGSLPVYVSMRNGDAGPSFQIKECLERCVDLLNESKIKVGRVISDAAGYNKEFMTMLDNKGIKFNIRFSYKQNMKNFNTYLKQWNTWRPTEIKTATDVWTGEVADIPYKMFDRPDEKISKTWRLVTMRFKSGNIETKDDLERRESIGKKMEELNKKNLLKQNTKSYQDKNWKEINGYVYKFFITNDWSKTSEEIIKEYNKRGDAERKFSFMKNDFGWNLPPFSDMNENAVFLIASSLANNIYRGMINVFKKNIPQLRSNMRLPEFQFIFIDVACAYINGIYDFFSTDIAYEKIV